jgi:hypothetical protein
VCPADHAVPVRIRQLLPARHAEGEGHGESAPHGHIGPGGIDNGEGGIEASVEVRCLEEQVGRGVLHHEGGPERHERLGEHLGPQVGAPAERDKFEH